MPNVTINGTDVEVEKGTTILEAAAEAGYEIPHFCYHPALSIPANCRMCLVEIEDNPDLEPGCYTPVQDGMVVHTESQRVVKARKAILEFILLNHPVDCPICDQAGECKLQDYYMDYDAQESRLRTQKVNKVKVYPLGPEVVYDGERCILCTRCIRFCDEITETGELRLVNRSDHKEIRTFPDKELDNNYSMCTVDICPVGALTSRDFRFKCRVWLLTSTDSVCTGCSKGCNIHLEHFQNEIQRYRPRYNPDVNDYWMCDDGRLSYKQVHSDRVYQPRHDDHKISWHRAKNALANRLGRAFEKIEASEVAFVASPQASCEGLYAGRQFASEVLGTDNIFANGKPNGFEDDFLIEADKNPNRRGIEAVWGDFEQIGTFGALVDEIVDGSIRVVYMMDSHLPLEEDEREAALEALDELDLFILQSQHNGEVAEKADIVLPATSHAEKDGTFVNEDGIAQKFYRAFAPHGNSRPDWEIFTEMAEVFGDKLPHSKFLEIREHMFDALEDEDAYPESSEPGRAVSTPAE